MSEKREEGEEGGGNHNDNGKDEQSMNQYLLFNFSTINKINIFELKLMAWGAREVLLQNNLADKYLSRQQAET